MEAVLVGLVVDPVGLAVGSLVLEATGDLERLVVRALIRDHCRLFLLVAVALLVAVVVAVDADVVVLFLLRDRNARVLAGLLLRLGRGQARGYHQRYYQDLRVQTISFIYRCYFMLF